MKADSLITAGIEGAKALRANGLHPLTEGEAQVAALELIAQSEVAMVGSNDELDYPTIKAMFKIEADGYHTIWFSTNTSSRRVQQFLLNPKATVYFFDAPRFTGLLLIGQIDVVSNQETKQRFWREGWEVYYPLGSTDPDYSLLRFTAFRADYYAGLQSIQFRV